MFNYTLIWVILFSNLMAIFVQIMSAKLGIATGKNLPQVCGEFFKRPTNWVLWTVAEISAMATDLAEVLGGALGFYLLFGIPMAYASVLTGLITICIVHFAKYGQKVIEIIISALVAVICFAYSIELFLAKPDWALVGIHAIIPYLPNSKATLIAVGILGATVMPHVIYLHSELVQCRNGKKIGMNKKRHFKMERLDIVIAMNIAFIINAAMLITSAAVFYRNGLAVETIEQAHQTFQPLLGSFSAAAFGVALLASGLSSSAVGTLAGQTIMKGFVGLSIPLNIRRIITLLPAMVIILLGINPMNALIISQVVLSFTLPFAIIPLLLISMRKDVLGAFANSRLVNIIGWIIASIIILINMLLLFSHLLLSH